MKKAITNLWLFVILLVVVAANYQCNGKDDTITTPAPVLTSLDTTSGIVGDPVVISGSNLQNATGVSFNGKGSTIVTNNASSITTVVPPNATAGNNDIKVQTSAGSSNTLPFEVFATPAHVDEDPPTLLKTIPTINYTDYPVLIYGDNLSGTVKVTFNDKNAVIFTNNKKVITTSVPADVPAGPVTVKVTTLKGSATLQFQVQGPPPGGPAGINFNIVDVPPPSYVPTIANNWTCGLFSDVDSGFVDLNSDPEFDQTYFITGRYEFDFENDYNDLNYIEFTNHETGETFAGQFSSESGTPCILKMVLISSKTGTISECTFDLRINEPDLVCDE